MFAQSSSFLKKLTQTTILPSWTYAMYKILICKITRSL
uniref:Uncharacterized protein n=1 Tax=Setaria italica TaxID=4555 RepID=K3Z1J1_SETIT